MFMENQLSAISIQRVATATNINGVILSAASAWFSGAKLRRADAESKDPYSRFVLPQQAGSREDKPCRP
jgi:hypothetical protein